MPALGTVSSLTFTNLPPDSLLAILVAAPQAINVPLDPLGAPGCNVQVNGPVVPMTLTGSTAVLSLNIPTNIYYLGLVLELQSVALSASSNALGVALSNRGTMTVGSTHIFAGPMTNPANGHRYVILHPDQWSAAQSIAHALGGDLVTINDAGENAWITSFVANSIGGSATQVWIGLSRVPTGPWAWSSNEPVSFVNWAPGEPNNAAGNEFCSALYPINNQWGQAGQWNDAPGDWVMFSVVEI